MNYAVTKARQKIVLKKRLERSEIPGERFLIDISSPKTKGFEGYRNWLLCVEDYTDMPFSFFISEKSQLEEVLEPFSVDLKNMYGIIVKIVCVTTRAKTGHLRKPVNQKDTSILPPVHHNKTDELNVSSKRYMDEYALC